MKGSAKCFPTAGEAMIMDRQPALSTSRAKGALSKQQEAEILDLQQMLLEHSSEKSCQEQLGRSSAATLTGCAQKDEVEGSSSQGSEPSHRHAWQEEGEQTWESATPRCVHQPILSSASSPLPLLKPRTWWSPLSNASFSHPKLTLLPGDCFMTFNPQVMHRPKTFHNHCSGVMAQLASDV